MTEYNPFSPIYDREGFVENKGISVRDWFAGQALNGMMSNSAGPVHTPDEVADSAYTIADAMMRVRNL